MFQVENQCDFSRFVDDILYSYFIGDISRSYALSSLGRYVGTEDALELLDWHL